MNISDNDRKLFAHILNKKINFLFAKTLEELVEKELLKGNPAAQISVKLCTEADKKEAEEIVKKKVQESKQKILYECSPYLEETKKIIIRNHEEMISNVISRIYEHKKQISKFILGTSDFEKIITISGDGADVHNHGQLTLMVEIDKGKFMYKPHNCKMDTIVYGLATQYFSDMIRVPKALDFEDYGFCEFIENNPAKSKEEAKEFYFHFGGLAAFITILGGTDFHYDNILSNENYPVPVDLETMMMPAVEGFHKGYNQLDYMEDYNYSIANSCLLPMHRKDSEFSPLIKLTKENRCAPVINGIMQTVLEYENVFLEGFDIVYNRCLDLKKELLQAVEDAKDTRIRFLIRNTNDYVSIMHALNLPKNALNQSGQEYILSKLRVVFDNNINKEYVSIAEAEAKSLKERDIPYFYSVGDSHHLFSDGKIVVSDLFEKTATENAKMRIQRLDESEREFEKKLIHSSLRCAYIPDDKKTVFLEREEKITLEKEKILDEAEALWNSIWESSIVFPCGSRSFCGNYSASENFSCIGQGFANGIEGIVVFASALNAFGRGSKKQTEIISETATEYIEKVLDICEREEVIPDGIKNKGLTSGLAGMIKMLELTKKFTPTLFDENYLERIVHILNRTDIEKEDNPDAYGGLAGLIISLCSISNDYDIKEYVQKAANRIIELKTIEDKDLLLWKTVGKERVVSGYAHGMAGIGIALLKAYSLTKEERFFKAAEDAFLFEHRNYSERIFNWPDLRKTSVPDSTLNGICTGAPGIGLAMQIAEKFDIPYTKEDKILAIEAVRKKGLMNRDTLCCGNCSVIEFLISSGLKEEALTFLGKMKKKQEIKEEYTYIPINIKNYFVPTLFYGASGLGYTLLRAVDSDYVPSLFI